MPAEHLSTLGKIGDTFSKRIDRVLNLTDWVSKAQTKGEAGRVKEEWDITFNEALNELRGKRSGTQVQENLSGETDRILRLLDWVSKAQTKGEAGRVKEEIDRTIEQIKGNVIVTLPKK